MESKVDFFHAYSAVYRPLTNHMNRMLEKYDLSNSYWRVLRIVEQAEMIKVGEITDALKIEKPAATKIIKKLSILHVVEVVRGQDKREKYIKLTREGIEKMAEIRKELHPFFQHALAGLTSEQIENAIEVLYVVEKNIKN